MDEIVSPPTQKKNISPTLRAQCQNVCLTPSRSAKGSLFPRCAFNSWLPVTFTSLQAHVYSPPCLPYRPKSLKGPSQPTG